MEIANPNRVTASTIISKPMALPDTRRELDSLRKLDPQAVAAIYDRYFPDVYRYVFYRLGNESLAEDIASDVFVRLLEAVKTKRGPKTHLKGWLLSTASNVIADHLRRVYRRPTEALSEAMPDLGSSLTDEVDRRHQADSVRQAYAQLTPEQQNVLALRFGDGYSLEETAAVMQKKVNAVKALQFRALAALQRHIGEVSYE
jgi:RNA polymerase sigma-70 factor (ECF subfamily)